MVDSIKRVEPSSLAGPDRRIPPSFWWGTAASATQAEGSHPGDTWNRWEQDHPDLEPSGVGNNFADRYVEDFQLLRAFGLDHHRLSIDWARIEPERGVRVGDEVARYRRILEAGQAEGMNLWLCLHHFTLPTWFADTGGFLSESNRRGAWARHVDFVADTYGDLIYGWQPVNEPLGFAGGGWFAGEHPPGRQNFEEFLAMLEATHLAKIEAAHRLRGSMSVATIHNLVPHYPANNAAREITEVFERLYWDSWITAVRDGELRVPGRGAVSVPEAPEAFDIIGFTYYMARTVHADMTTTPHPSSALVTERGDAVWSEGLGVVIDRLREQLPGRSLLVAEHGVGTNDDELRCEVLRASIDIVGHHLAHGADLRGFFHWTGIDNYEWQHGWSVPFGCFTRQREPKASAHLLRSYAAR